MSLRHLIQSIFPGFLVLILSVNAQSQNLSFRQLTVEDGLSQNAVMAIAQDKKGFIWIGTRYGLNRYDGIGFKTYKYSSVNKNSLSDNLINALLVDDNGTLWVGTSNGLNKYDPVKDNFERIFNDPKDQHSLNNSSINCLYQDIQKRIWVGTKSGLNLLTDKKTNRFQSMFGKTNQTIGNYIRTVFQSSDGILWVGTSTGLIKINNQGSNYEITTFLHNNADAASISADYITSIIEDKQKNLWIGTLRDGLNLYNKNTKGFSHFLQSTSKASSLVNNSIRKLFLDNTGKLLIGTQDGLMVFDPVTKQSNTYQHDPEIKTSLSNNSVHSIYQDANGTIWIGTYHGGLNVSYAQNTAFHIYQNTRSSNSLSNNVISSIIADNADNLWIGTEGGGLNLYNKRSKSFFCYKNIPNDSSSISSNLVKVVYKDKNNNIWAGVSYGGGLNLFDRNTNKFKRITVEKSSKETVSFDEVVALLEDHKGNFWVGSQSGLTILKKRNGQFDNRTSLTPIEQQLHNKNIHVLFEDSKQNLWIGTSSGLHLLKNNSTSVITFLQNENPNSLQSDYINCITEDSKHRIWIGTYYGGFSLFNEKDQTFTSYTDKNGLRNNNVLGILEDIDDNLWLSTDNGLSKFDIKEKTFKNYTTSDGLSANKFNNNSFYKNSNGEMFFGGNNGFISFNPNDLQTNNSRAAVVLTGLKLFNKVVPIDGEENILSKDINFLDEIEFSHNQNTFTIEFALLNYIKPEKNIYAYRLKGFENDWSYTSNAFATYNNLPPGNYTFEVKAANNDGLWIDHPTTLKMSVLPPIWKTWWAYCLYMITLVAITFFFMRFFWMRELYKREHELQQFKLNFFTNISHEIKTHLTLISGPVEKLMNSSINSLEKKQLEHVRSNADKLLNLVRELMDFRKAETNNLPLHVTKNNIVRFVEEIHSSFQETADAKTINLTFSHSKGNIELYFDKRQMEKVIFNLLTNAFKFTPDGGNISVEIIEARTDVQIRIADDGKGIAPENLKRLFANFFQVNDDTRHNTGYGIGLALSKSIVELHKGNITVTSELANDASAGHTIFTVALLKGNQHFSEKELTPSTHQTSSLIEHVSLLTPSEDQEEINNKKPTILLVEDNDELRLFINESLSNEYNIIESNNGISGAESAFENIPDLIISDVMMPEMDGLSLAKKLRSDERTSHIPVILLTARASTDNQVDGLETGVDAYITKPFSMRVLELQVRNLIASRLMMRQKFSKQIFLEPTKTVINTIDEGFLNKVISIIEEHIEDPQFGVAMLASKVAMSQPILYKKLKAVTDMSVNDLIKSIRLKRAAQLLGQKQMTVYQVAYAVGYIDRKYFSQEFKKQFGKTPTEYANLSEQSL